jgi:hypothetical protein
MASKRQSPTTVSAPDNAALIFEQSSGLPAEIVPIPQADVSDILDACCNEFLVHHERYVDSAMSALQHALAAGKYAILIKETVGHGVFRAFCERRFPHVRFRRVEQFKTLAEREDELLDILRAANAQRDAHLTAAELLASLSIRKAQRLLSGNLADSEPKPNAKRRRKTIRSRVYEQECDDWLTPLDIVEASWALLGGIDLDPAAGNNPHLARVPRRIGPDEDGLAPEVLWSGSVFMHPPCQRIGEWVSRCRSEFTSGSVREAMLLVPALTDSPWFVALATFAKGFLRQRPQFTLPRRSTPQVADLPYAVVHLARGEDRLAAFAAAFGELADVHLPFVVR